MNQSEGQAHGRELDVAKTGKQLMRDPRVTHLGVTHAAEVLGLCRSMVRRYCQRGDIPAMYVQGLGYLIHKNDLRRFAKQERRRGGRPKGG